MRRTLSSSSFTMATFVSEKNNDRVVEQSAKKLDNGKRQLTANLVFEQFKKRSKTTLAECL